MTAKLARRAAAFGLTLVVVAFVITFIYGFASSSDVRIPGARLTVDEVPGESLSASFDVEPIELLVTWLVLSAVVFVVLRLFAADRRRA